MRIYATDRISGRLTFFLPTMEIASGIVLSPPTTLSASPAAFIASLLSPLAINKPTPTPSATRVPVQSIISGRVTLRSIIVPPFEYLARNLVVGCEAMAMGSPEKVRQYLRSRSKQANALREPETYVEPGG